MHKGSCDWKLSSLKVFRVRQNEKWDKILTLFLPYSDFEIEKSLKENTSIDCTQWRTDDDYPYGDILQCKARNIESGEEIEGVYNTETPWLHLNTNRFRNVTVNFKPIVKLERNCAGDVVVVE
ncbi:hypothetical protein [Desulfovibrio litoralis]|uniref:hypothetical protein n=1 Tax=Desulfovibrio litoralis TaxID=466107 RepID=UPI0011602DEB|nr:hypothetical protein [Desulfovibrio litoralis]